MNAISGKCMESAICLHPSKADRQGCSNQENKKLAGWGDECDFAQRLCRNLHFAFE